MHLAKVILVASAIGSAYADLTCLGWGFVVTILGVICHFKPDIFHDKEQKVIESVENGVQEVIDDAKDLVEFDLTHNPVAVTFDYVSTAINNGTDVAKDHVLDVAKDYGKATVGFTKGSANQAYSIYNLLDWRDLSYCLLRGGVDLARKADTQSKRRGIQKRLPSISKEAAASTVNRCVSNKFSKPALFNITGQTPQNLAHSLIDPHADPNERIGSTISNLAALFIPIGLEAKEGAEAATAGFDLVIPGSEDTARILKNVGKDGADEAGHFASTQEAKSVAEQLEKDPNWEKENCGLCGGGSAISPTLPVQTARRRRLLRRASPSGFCCRPPATVSESGISSESAGESDSEGASESANDQTSVLSPFEPYSSPFGNFVPPDEEEEAPSLSSSSSSEAESDSGQSTSSSSSSSEPDPYVWVEDSPIYDPGLSEPVPESQLSSSPDFTSHDIRSGDQTALNALEYDLKKDGTGAVAFSSELKAPLSPKDALSKQRALFTGDKGDPLYKALRIKQRGPNDPRLYWTNFNLEASEGNDAVKPWLDFTNAAVDQGKETVSKLLPNHYPSVNNLDGSVEFFWTPPNAPTAAGPAPLTWGTGLMDFTIQDRPGLVMKNVDTGTVARYAVKDDAFYCQKGLQYEFFTAGDSEVTLSGVYGPEMAQDGRLSMIVHIRPAPGNIERPQRIISNI